MKPISFLNARFAHKKIDAQVVRFLGNFVYDLNIAAQADKGNVLIPSTAAKIGKIAVVVTAAASEAKSVLIEGKTGYKD